MSKEFSKAEIPSAPLIVDAVYKSDASASGGFDSLPALLKCGNQGGFRKVSKCQRGITLRCVVLLSW